MILQPKPLTLARWWRLPGARVSLLRALEYECLPDLRLTGLTLDVGGGARTGYLHLLRTEGQIESVNVDPAIQSTYVADLNGPLPIPSDRYDNAISLNTLEHVADDRNALREICRVLKLGGNVHLFVPFLWRVHASPNDYHRHTASAWTLMLTEAGFAPDSIVIEPLAFGRPASAFAQIEFTFPTPVQWLLRKTVMLLWVLRESLRRTPGPEFDLPLGYHIVARKVEP